MADQSERRSCLALCLRRIYDGTTPGTGGTLSLKWREMGGNVTTPCTRGTASLAKAVMALYQYLRFLAFSGA